MLKKFLSQKKILYLNDRHEEADTGQEDRRKLYDKRILPLLSEGDLTVFAEKIDPFLWNYYKNLGLATVKETDVFYEKNYLNYPSLTKALLRNENFIKTIKKRNVDLLSPYIESFDSEILAKRIFTSTLRKAKIVDWINNKSNFRRVSRDLGFPVIPGCSVKNLKEARASFKRLKKLGFQKIVLKKERSVAGFGVFVVKNEEELVRIIENKLSEEKSFLTESLVKKIILYPNLQYWVEKEGIKFVTLTDQIISQDGVSYQGNRFPSELTKMPRIHRRIENLSLKFCQFLKEKQCYGLVGIDWLVTKNGQVYSTEANVRWNASTFCQLIIEKLFGNERVFWESNSLFLKPTSFENFLQKFSKHLIAPKNKFGVFPGGIDFLPTLGEGQFLIVGRSLKEVKKHFDYFDKPI